MHTHFWFPKPKGRDHLNQKRANTGIQRNGVCVCVWIGLKWLTTDTSDRQIWGSTEGRELEDITQCRCVLSDVSKESIALICKDRRVQCTGPLSMKMYALLTFQTSGNTNPTTQRHTPDNTAVTTPHLAQVGFSTSQATVRGGGINCKAHSTLQ